MVTEKLEALANRAAAVASFRLGRLEEAVDFIEKAIEINRSLRNAKGRSLDLILGGKISLAQQNYPKALTQFEEAQRILPTSEAAEVPGLMRDLAKVNIKLLRLPEAITILNRLSAYYSKNNDLEQAAGIWAEEGDLYLLKGDYGNAAVLLKKAEKTFLEHNKEKELGQTLYRLAYLALISGDFKQTKSYLDAAKQHGSCHDEKWPIALQSAIKAMNSFDHGSSDQASKELAEARIMLGHGQHILLKSRIQMLQAKVETELCNWKMAEDCASTALQEFKKLSNLEGEAEAEQSLAQIYFRQSFF